jgi:hypothetical protein
MVIILISRADSSIIDVRETKIYALWDLSCDASIDIVDALPKCRRLVSEG